MQPRSWLATRTTWTTQITCLAALQNVNLIPCFCKTIIRCILVSHPLLGLALMVHYWHISILHSVICVDTYCMRRYIVLTYMLIWNYNISLISSPSNSSHTITTGTQPRSLLATRMTWTTQITCLAVLHSCTVVHCMYT